MAYRADVRLILSKEGFNKIQNYINGKIKDTEYNVLDNPDYKYDTESHVYLAWYNLEWYLYNSINYLQEGLNKLKEENISYFIFREGSPDKEIEEKSFEIEEPFVLPMIIRQLDNEYISKNSKNLERKNKNKGGDSNAKAL